MFYMAADKIETGEPKDVTIQEVRTKTLELKNKIYALIQEFETDTGYSIELDVRLN